MDRRNKTARTTTSEEPLPRRSGAVARHRSEPDRDADFAAARSQLRRRFELEVDLEVRRAETDAPNGIPTPPPPLPLTSIPRRLMADEKVLTLPLDHRAGFVLTLVDGNTSVRTLLDVCGMPHAELVEVIDRLIALGAIELT